MTRYGDNKLTPSDLEVKAFLEYWERRGIELPNPQNYPKCFLYYVKLWKYYTARDE